MKRVGLLVWGWKHGAPPATELAFDLRGLRNPYHIPGLRDLTGFDAQVRHHIWADPKAEDRYQKIRDVVFDYLQPRDEDVSVCFSCTGGKHRSLTFALRLQEELEAAGMSVWLRAPHAEKARTSA